MVNGPLNRGSGPTLYHEMLILLVTVLGGIVLNANKDVLAIRILATHKRAILNPVFSPIMKPADYT